METETQLSKKELALMKIAVAKQLLAYQTQVREDRLWQFERWDSNSAALIVQYKLEIEQAQAEIEKCK
jgi:hypothetical protein